MRCSQTTKAETSQVPGAGGQTLLVMVSASNGAKLTHVINLQQRMNPSSQHFVDQLMQYCIAALCAAQLQSFASNNQIVDTQLAMIFHQSLHVTSDWPLGSCKLIFRSSLLCHHHVDSPNAKLDQTGLLSTHQVLVAPYQCSPLRLLRFTVTKAVHVKSIHCMQEWCTTRSRASSTVCWIGGWQHPTESWVQGLCGECRYHCTGMHIGPSQHCQLRVISSTWL